MKKLLLSMTVIAFMFCANSVFAKGQIYHIKPKITASQQTDQTQQTSQPKQIAKVKVSYYCNCC